jgi:hypothetical protein
MPFTGAAGPKGNSMSTSVAVFLSIINNNPIAKNASVAISRNPFLDSECSDSREARG